MSGVGGVRTSASVSTPGTLHFRVLEARDLASADPNGYSDPYVKVKVSDANKEKSQTIRKTLNPVWNWDSSFVIKNWSGDVTFEVMDDDEYSSNDFLGFLKLSLAEIFHARTHGGWFRLMDKKNQHITSGRIFIVFAVDLHTADRSKREKRSILHWATLHVAEDIGRRKRHVAARRESVNSHAESLAHQTSNLSVSSSSSSSSAHSSTSFPVTENLSVFVGSWNVGNAEAPADLGAWLEPGHSIYAVGVQECKYEVSSSKTKGISSLTACGTHFEHICQKTLGDQYVLVKKEELMEIRHLIFARKHLLERIDHVTSGVEATGLAGVVGNKGGVGVGFTFDDISMCFITAHLAAHQDKTQKRNEDVRDITANLKLNSRGVDVHHSFHHVFFSGDLNYRLNTEQGDAHSPTQEQFDAIVNDINSGDAQRLRALFEKDQLLDSIHKGLVFRNGWVDSPFSGFAPTFKVARHVVGPEYKNQRSPAWCDRVLWRTFLPRDIRAQFAPKQVAFKSVPAVDTSDHKPVFGVFEVPVVQLPLATDFTKGSLRVRFTRLTVHKLGSYAQRNPSNPLVKFYGSFLTKSESTKFKSVSDEGETSGSEPAPASASAVTPLSPGADSAKPDMTRAPSSFFTAVATSAKNTFSPKQPATEAVAGEGKTYSWSDEEIPVLHSQVNNIQRLKTQSLIVKVLSYTFESSLENLIASARVDLSQGASGKLVEFDEELEFGGLPAGRVSGAFQLLWEEDENFTPLPKEEVEKLIA